MYDGGQALQPIGMLTDRDIALRRVAPGKDAEAASIGRILAKRLPPLEV